MGFDTAGNIVADAAAELGLISYAAKNGLDPFGSSDANLGQLAQLLKAAGTDLLRRRAWSQFSSTYAFVTISGQATYALPPDFSRIVEETEWNRTNRLPLGGPLSPQEWGYVKGQLSGVVFNVLYRIEQGQIRLYPDVNTPAGYTIAFEYVSNAWVQSAAQAAYATTPWLPSHAYAAGNVSNAGNAYQLAGAGTSGSVGPTGTGNGIADGTCTWNYLGAAAGNAPSAAGDTILFDSHLASRALKLFWKREKGLDTTSAQADFDDAFEQACAMDKPGRALRLGTSIANHPRFIGSSNIPITGIGGGT